MSTTSLSVKNSFRMLLNCTGETPSSKEIRLATKMTHYHYMIRMIKNSSLHTLQLHILAWQVKFIGQKLFIWSTLGQMFDSQANYFQNVWNGQICLKHSINNQYWEQWISCSKYTVYTRKLTNIKGSFIFYKPCHHSDFLESTLLPHLFRMVWQKCISCPLNRTIYNRPPRGTHSSFLITRN